MKWYILYGQGDALPVTGESELDTEWTLLLCGSEEEALAMSCRLLKRGQIVREIGTMLRDERRRTKDVATIVSHCAAATASRNLLT